MQQVLNKTTMRKFFLFFLTIFTLISCKKTVEGENQAFESNLRQLNELMSEYPQFKPALQQCMNEGKKAMEEARKVSDEKQRIEKMAQANTTLYPISASDLNNIRNLKDKLKREISDESDLKKLSRNEQNTLDRAIDDARDAEKKADRYIMDHKADNLSEMAGYVANATRELNAAYDDLNRLKNRYKKPVENKDKDKDKNNNSKDGKDSESNTSKVVKCEYCGKKVDATKEKCESCGASLKN